MGLKRDLFVVKIKKKYEYAPYTEIIELIPEEYNLLFSILWNEFQNLSDMINKNNTENLINVLKKNSNFFENMDKFYGYYRFKDCLQQVIRKIFFDTVMIIQNIYSPNGINLFDVLEKEQMLNVSLCKNSLEKNNSSNPQENGEVVFDRMIANVNAEDFISEEMWETEEPIELKYLRTKIVNMKEESIDPVQEPR